METFVREPWEKYKERLIRIGYTEEEMEAVKQVRENYEYMSFEQFDFLFRQGVIKRTNKLRIKRCLYVCDNGRVWYLNHHRKQFFYCGYFVNQNEPKE